MSLSCSKVVTKIDLIFLSDLTNIWRNFPRISQPFSFFLLISISIFFSLKLLFEQSFKLFYSFHHELTVNARKIKKVKI